MAVTTAAKPLPFEKIPFWHLVPFSVYLIANAVLIHQYWADLGKVSAHVTPFSLAVIGLATFRMANIVANEQVTKVFRAPFVNVQEKEDGDEEEPKPTGWKGMVGSLLYCASCSGVWVATGFAYCLMLAPEFAFFAAVPFALSAIERFLTGGLKGLERLSGH